MKITYTIQVDGVKIATIGCQDRKWGEDMVRYFLAETIELYPTARNIKLDRMDLGAKIANRRFQVLADGPPVELSACSRRLHPANWPGTSRKLTKSG